jgi:hypothetical protein
MNGPPPLKESFSTEENLHIIGDAIEKEKNASGKTPTSLLASDCQRNSLLPIFRLPSEIVHYIFALVQKTELDSTKLDHREQGQASLKWINLTHVCRQWRDIALDSPTLWVHLPIGNLRWVEEMLRRSKDSSLLVEGSLRSSLPDSGLELAFEHFQRIKALSLRNLSTATWDGFHGMLPTSAPQLETLCLEGEEFDESLNPDDPLNLLPPPISYDPRNFMPLPISRDVLRQTGRLRKLSLTNCEVHWNSHFHLLRSLLHLKLTSLPATSALTEIQLMDALKGMPELESLELRNGAFRIQTDGQASWSSENIHLARLRNLEVSSDFLGVDTFFRWVTFPPTATVRVVCFNQPNPDFSIFGLGRSYSNATPDTPFQSLIISKAIPHRLGGGIKLKLFVEALNESDMIHHWRDDAIARLELVFFSDRLTNILGDIFNSAIPLHDITHLYFAERVLSANTIANMLGTLPRVHSVVAGEDAARPFFDAMCLGMRVDPAGSNGNAAQTMAYFPHVSSICLYDMLFPKTWQLPQVFASRASGGGVTDGMSMELLRDFLMERCEFGVPVNTLILRACYGKPRTSLEKDVKLLKEIVVDVDWDGCEYGVEKTRWEEWEEWENGQSRRREEEFAHHEENEEDYDQEEEDEEDYDQEEEEDQVDEYPN